MPEIRTLLLLGMLCSIGFSIKNYICFLILTKIINNPSYLLDRHNIQNMLNVCTPVDIIDDTEGVFCRSRQHTDAIPVA